MHCGVLYTRIREDEKLLVEALRAAGHDVTKIDVRELCFHLEDAPAVLDDLDVAVTGVWSPHGAGTPRDCSTSTGSKSSTTR
jgi:chloramphenicol 3-O-phosphotransferase